jgi:hypothetical protein
MLPTNLKLRIKLIKQNTRNLKMNSILIQNLLELIILHKVKRARAN